MEINLEPKQALAFHTVATEVLYGGAAGGMKSYLLRVSAIRWCLEVGGVQVYLFRRTLPDLRDNHLRGPTSFQMMLGEHLKSGHVKYRSVENEFEFWNGSILHLCYCDSENDVEKYRGAEIHVLLIDELTHFTEFQYRFLRSRVRRAGLTVPEAYRGRLPRIETASNPGSVGHAWVKRTWISPKPELEIWRAPPAEGGMARQFIPAKLSDNPYLTRDDPQYANRLRGLGSDSLVRAMLDGDWDIIAGQAFEKLRRETHCIDPFTPPEDWLCFGSFDWGSSRPYSYGLWTVANGDALADGRIYPRGAIIRYDENYGWNGKPNEGCRMEVREVAQEILKAENGRTMAYRIADSSIWNVDGGPSIGETFNKHRVIMRPAPKGKGSRHNGYVEVRNRIAGGPEGPMLYATRNCHDGFWRTMPDLVMDEHQHGINSEQIDCWVAGTMIATPKSEVPIENVCIGDWVVTPIGPRKVTKSYLSGTSETVKLYLSNGCVLEGTGRHKIATANRGLVPLDDVEYSDILIERNTQWQQRRLCIKARLTACIRGINTTSAVSTFTNWSGWRRTESLLRAIISTIKTETQRITDLKIWNVYLQGNTHSITTTTAFLLDQSKGNGRGPPKESASFAGISKNADNQPRRKNLRAVIVEGLSPQIIREKYSVRLNAKTQRTGLIKIALSAASHLSQSIIPQRKSAPVLIVAAGRCVEKKNVYNLTVDEAHLFYANGILSSNTDQEDHCADEVTYACVSRPWIKVVEKPKDNEDWWLRFDKPEEETWRTA